MYAPIRLGAKAFDETNLNRLQGMFRGATFNDIITDVDSVNWRAELLVDGKDEMIAMVLVEGGVIADGQDTIYLYSEDVF